MRQFVGIVLIALCAVFAQANATTCSSPKATVTSFSTQDATILTQLAHVGEFSLKCGGDGGKPTLFAEFPCGKVVPVAQIGDDKYQVSWTEEIKKGSSGSVVVRLFDEEGYTNLRKVQRDGGKAANVKSLVDITINTKGAYKGPWVKAEIVAALMVGAVAYYAVSNKNKVQA